ncbi:MAG: ATP-binding protein [Muribaculum sp.]|nr:ATP-binding protein [Muribaculum sp.]
MYRKAYKKLLDWKMSDRRKPLLLLGARQVGKTWLMKEFGANEYENIAYINCDGEPLTKTLFLNDYDIDRLLVGFQAITGQSINKKTTLIILDELQEAPRGLHSLKYFCENAPEYHIMAAGSLLGVTLGQKESYPVGKVDTVDLNPMDFEEFLMAMGQTAICEILRNGDIPLAMTFSHKLKDYLYQYYYIGGMPEVVGEFVLKKDLNRAREVQMEIIEAYRRDISKHTSKIESIRIGQVLSSLPSQLAKGNKKFVYGVAKKGGRAADFELAIQWLVDAGLVYKVNRVNKVAVPLKFYEDLSAFKLFFLDVGLLSCMSDVPSKILLGGGDMLEEYKGMLTEEYVAQQLISNGNTLFYWSNERTPAKLDFVLQYGDSVYPVEVKAGENVRGKSIAQFVKDNPGTKGLRFSILDFKDQGWIVNIPLYAVPFLHSIM